MKRIIRVHALIAVLLICLQSPASAEGHKTLLIGLMPELNIFKQNERYKPLADYLSRETGMEVKTTIPRHYRDIFKAFKAHKLDAAFFGSLTGAQAIRQLKVEPLARPVGLDGQSAYHGLIYVRKDSGIRNAAQMKGKRIALVDKSTSGGYLFPLAYLRKNGIKTPDGYFSEQVFAGTHDGSILMVLDRKAEIGASKNTVFDDMRAKEPRIDRELEIIARSANLPSNALLVRNDLDPRTKNVLKATLLDMHKSAEGREVLEKLGALMFVATGAADYAPVAKLAAEAGVDLNR